MLVSVCMMLSLTSGPLNLTTSLAASKTCSNGRSYRPDSLSGMGNPPVLSPVTVSTQPTATITDPTNAKQIFSFILAMQPHCQKPSTEKFAAQSLQTVSEPCHGFGKWTRTFTC